MNTLSKFSEIFVFVIGQQPVSLNFQQINLNNSNINKLHFGDASQEEPDNPVSKLGDAFYLKKKQKKEISVPVAFQLPKMTFKL